MKFIAYLSLFWLGKTVQDTCRIIFYDPVTAKMISTDSTTIKRGLYIVRRIRNAKIYDRLEFVGYGGLNRNRKPKKQ